MRGKRKCQNGEYVREGICWKERQVGRRKDEAGDEEKGTSTIGKVLKDSSCMFMLSALVESPHDVLHGRDDQRLPRNLARNTSVDHVEDGPRSGLCRLTAAPVPCE